MLPSPSHLHVHYLTIAIPGPPVPTIPILPGPVKVHVEVRTAHHVGSVLVLRSIGRARSGRCDAGTFHAPVLHEHAPPSMLNDLRRTLPPALLPTALGTAPLLMRLFPFPLRNVPAGSTGFVRSCPALRTICDAGAVTIGPFLPHSFGASLGPSPLRRLSVDLLAFHPVLCARGTSPLATGLSERPRRGDAQNKERKKQHRPCVCESSYVSFHRLLRLIVSVRYGSPQTPDDLPYNDVPRIEAANANHSKEAGNALFSRASVATEETIVHYGVQPQTSQTGTRATPTAS